MSTTVPRRQVLRVGGALALGLPSVALSPRAAAARAGKGGAVRLASVTTIADGGLLEPLVAGFAAESGYEVAVHTGEDIYERARTGEADLVLSHLGHRGVRAFVAEGLGQWPRAVLFNQTALLAHPSDPADVRGAADPVEAFRRIAAAGAAFIVNDIDGQRYIVE